MNHTPEFYESATPEEYISKQRDLAACYARLFLGTEDGKRVLADLRVKFGVHRLCFVRNEGHPLDYLSAALTDGERRVMTEIENALTAGAPGQALKTKL